MKKIILAFATLLLSVNVISQQNDTTKIDDYYIDFSVPDIGAFTLLSVKPEQITNPGSTKELAASLLNIVSSRTKITPGLAIDWAPYQTFRKDLSIAEYKKKYLIRNLQATFGTIADSLGTRVGFGAKWTFLDKSDPLLDEEYSARLNSLHHAMFEYKERSKNKFLRNVTKLLRQLDTTRKFPTYLIIKITPLLDPNDTDIVKQESAILFKNLTDSINSLIKEKVKSLNQNLNGAELEKKLDASVLTIAESILIHNLVFDLKAINAIEVEYDKDIIKEFAEAKKQWKKDHWNAAVITIGSGNVWNSLEGTWGTLSSQVFKTYFNAKFPLKHWGQVSGIISFGKPKKPDVETDSTISSQLFAGGRFMFGNADNRFSIDFGYAFNRAKVSDKNQKIIALNLGLEFKVNDGIYLEIACGVQGKPNELFSAGNILSVGSLKYAFNKNRRFDIN